MHEELHILTAPLAPAKDPVNGFKAQCEHVEKSEALIEDPFPEHEDDLYINALQHELLASFKVMYENQFYAVHTGKDERDAYDAGLLAERYIDASETAGNMFEELLNAIVTFANNTPNAAYAKSANAFFDRLEQKFNRTMSALEDRAHIIARIENPKERLATIENTIAILTLSRPSKYPALFEFPGLKVRV